MFMRTGFLLPPIYDAAPEFVEYDLEGNTLVYDLWYVTKDGRTSIANFGEVIMPLDFEREQFTYLSDGVFKVNSEDQSLQFYDALAQRMILVRDSTSAVIPAKGRRYEAAAFDIVQKGPNREVIKTKILIAMEVDTSDFNPEHYSDPVDAMSFDHCIIIDRNSGDVITNYQKKDARYAFEEDRIISETIPWKGRKKKVQVKLYDVLNGEEVHAYKLRKKNAEDEPFISYHNGDIAVHNYRKRMGTLDRQTLVYTKSPKESNGSDCFDCGGCGYDSVRHASSGISSTNLWRNDVS
jgi:hypothetical protein